MPTPLEIAQLRWDSQLPPDYDDELDPDEIADLELQAAMDYAEEQILNNRTLDTLPYPWD